MGFFAVVEVEGAVQLVDVDGNERGTLALPLRIDPTGTTAQPVNGRAANGAAPVGSPVLVSGSDGSLVRTILTDAQGRIVTAPAGAFATHKGFADGKVVLAAKTPTAVYATAYTEQAANAQRSIVSSSANDAAAGTGARTVRVTYLTAAGLGPYTEDVTMNGTTPVNMVAVDVCFIERIEVLTVGGGKTNAGVISLKAATGGGGATVWSIAAGDGRTYGAHHYIPAGRVCRVTSLHVGIKGADTSSFTLKAVPLPIGNNYEEQIGDLIRVASSAGFLRTYGTPIEVAGPARVSVWALPDSTSSRTYYGSFDYYDEDV